MLASRRYHTPCGFRPGWGPGRYTPAHMTRTNENGKPVWRLANPFDKALYVLGCAAALYLALNFAYGFVQGFAGAF